VLGADAGGERQSGVDKSTMAVAGRGGNGLLLWTNSERIRHTGRLLQALRMEAGRQVVHVRVEVASGRQHRREVASGRD
jgi:hypothetical protein